VAACSDGAPTPEHSSLVHAAVASLTVPTGWTQDGAHVAICDVYPTHCTDDSQHRAFRTDAPAPESCATFIAWIAAQSQVVRPVSVVGAAGTSAPTATDCMTELASQSLYLTRAHATGDLPAASRWAMRLEPSPAGGFTLSVVLGSPPRDPWWPVPK
jgi:hypothetical protein